MKKLFFLGACLVVLASSPVHAQATKGEVVVVRIVDKASQGKVVVVRPGGKTEELALNQSLNSKGLVEAGLTLQQLVTTLTHEGYTLKSTFTSSEGFGATLIFIKE